MGLLRTEPAERIRSLPELLAIAHAMETEAAERYAELAAPCGRSATPPPRPSSTRSPPRSVATRCRRGPLAGEHRLAPDPADIAWEGWPEVFDAEELGTSRLVTPYQALSIAVRNEERAFAFWSYMCSDAEDPAIRREAERMAQEELPARRKAAQGTPPRLPRGPQRGPHQADPAGFAAAARATADALGTLCEALAARLEALGHPASGTMRSVADDEAAAARAIAR